MLNEDRSNLLPDWLVSHPGVSPSLAETRGAGTIAAATAATWSGLQPPLVTSEHSKNPKKARKEQEMAQLVGSLKDDEYMAQDRQGSLDLQEQFMKTEYLPSK
jgi:hypothetical protein